MSAFFRLAAVFVYPRVNRAHYTILLGRSKVKRLEIQLSTSVFLPTNMKRTLRPIFAFSFHCIVSQSETIIFFLPGYIKTNMGPARKQAPLLLIFQRLIAV